MRSKKVMVVVSMVPFEEGRGILPCDFSDLTLLHIHNTSKTFGNNFHVGWLVSFAPVGVWRKVGRIRLEQNLRNWQF